jgi:hypothetical protein
VFSNTKVLEKNTTQRVEIIFQTCLTFVMREEHGNTFALEMGQKSIRVFG